MDAFARDLRFAIRRLRKAPGFALTATLTLALGIGAATAMFSLIEGVLLRPLPFHDPDRLVMLGEHVGDSLGLGVAGRDVVTYQKATSAFSAQGGYFGASYELAGGAMPEDVRGARVAAGVFTTLGVKPALGRVFTQQEEDASNPLAVISTSLWMNRFHSDPQIIGKSIELNRRTFSIIGVMPRDFEFPLQTGRLNQAQVWVPLSLTPDELSEQAAGFFGYHIVGRLKDGVTVAEARQDVGRVAQQIMRDFPPAMKAIHLRGDSISLRDEATEDARPILQTLFASVLVVLMIACVNVAILMLVRAIRRQSEYALRLALGARTKMILREPFMEGLVISVTGGLLGLALAAVTIRTTVHLLPESMPRIDAISVDTTVALFAMGLALVTGCLCSLVPAFAASKTNLIDSLKSGLAKSSSARGHAWLRSSLVVVEIAVALVLLTVSGAFLRSYQKMLAVNLGYEPEHVLIAGYGLPSRQYPTDESVVTFNREVIERLRSKPGIVNAALSNLLPNGENYAMAAYTIESQKVEGWKLKFAPFGVIYGDYFQSLGIPLLAGRTFTMEDKADAPLVIIVNESMAEHSWPGQQAIGKRMHVGNPHKGLPWATVVGVVGNTREGSRDNPVGDSWYAPTLQPAILFGTNPSNTRTVSAGGYIVLRSVLPPEQMIPTLRKTIAEIDPMLALDPVRPMGELISNVEAPRRFNTDVIGAFALGALALAITGIYAVVAFTVSLRTQEIAIRMALGAQRREIARLVLASGGKLALLGCLLGVGGAFTAARVVRSFLFGVSATDPFTIACGVVAMLAIAMLASALPAVRAASADPVKSLRV